jgi:hypothetical protein
MTNCASRIGDDTTGTGESGSEPVPFVSTTKEQQGRCAMAKIDVRYLPHGNPCAQCSKPIAAPEWVEKGPGRISYLWCCEACDYRFEAVAFFEDEEADRLAA